MHNKCDFFQEKIKKCNGLAERASDKTDREFWLGMARRWEGMLEAGAARYRHDGGDQAAPIRRRASSDLQSGHSLAP
jgi:hypothetical protein